MWYLEAIIHCERDKKQRKMKSIRQSLKRTTSGRVSGAARSTQQTRRDLTAALAKGSEQESAKYYSQFEFSRFRKYFYNDYGWYPTLEQAKEVKDAFLRVDTKRQGMIKEDDLEDVLELLKPDTDEPIPVDVSWMTICSCCFVFRYDE